MVRSDPIEFESTARTMFASEVLAVPPASRRPSVIADANALISDAIRTTRSKPCVMPSLARAGVINLVTAEHIDEKVYARLPTACADTHTSLAAATAAYETVYRPLLRLVSVGDLMLDDPHAASVALADPDDDGPVAQLAVLLAPSMVLTMDKELIAAGFGVRDWADALYKLKLLVELDDLMWGTASGAELVARLTMGGVVELGRFLFRSEIALGITLGAVVGTLLWYRDEARDLAVHAGRRLGPPLGKAAKYAGELFEQRDAAERRVQPMLVLPGEDESLTAMVARALVQRREPLAGRKVHAQLPVEWREAFTVGDVMDELRYEAPFSLVRDRGWMLGRPAA
jgi:hypothetical protein